MVRELTSHDIEDCKARIHFQQIRVERLKGLGIGTEFAEYELRQLNDTLSHLEHHQKVLEYTLRSCAGILHGRVNKPRD